MGFLPVVCNRGRPLNPRPWPVPPGHHLARSYGCVLRPGRIYLFIYLCKLRCALDMLCKEFNILWGLLQTFGSLATR